jgi:hypothetical protein
MPSGQSFQIDVAKLYALISSSSGDRPGDDSQPDPEHPLKPGPWDPVIRVALKDVLRFGPQPDPWRYGPRPEPWLAAVLGADLVSQIARRFPAVWDIIGSLRIGDLVSLNPQPLPPRSRFVKALGEAFVARAETLAEVSSALETDRTGDERGIIIVGGYVNRLVDEYCGNGFRWRWPFPGPPPWWFKAEVDGHDLLVLGAHLNVAAEQAFDPALQQSLADASAKLAEAAIERLG